MICRCSSEQRWPESVLPFRLGDGDSLGSTPLLVEATWTSLDHYEHSSLKHAPAEAFHRLSAPINSKSPSVSMISDRNEGRREEWRRSTVEPKWEWWEWERVSVESAAADNSKCPWSVQSRRATKGNATLSSIGCDRRLRQERRYIANDEPHCSCYVSKKDPKTAQTREGSSQP